MIIFDLDGTLADIAHRRHFVAGAARRNNENWRRFFAACSYDQPVWPMIGLLDTLVRAGKTVEIWSGRSEEVRERTVLWLERHVVPPVPLRMRPEGNTDPDVALKERWLTETLAAGHKVDLVFDDRRRLVEMWRRRGIICCAVAEGDY